MADPRREATPLLLAGLMLIVATGCTAGDTTAATDPSPPGATDAGATDPEYCVELRATIEAAREDLITPGAVVLVRSPDLGDCFISVGTGDISDDDPIAIDDQFRIGSNTKTMTGTVVLQLVEEGMLSLDDRVSDYVDGVPDGENMTVDELLNMSTGLEDYSGLPAVGEKMDADPEYVWTPDELLALSYAQPVGFPPGEGFLYSNANTVLLGLIIEKLTGNPLEEELDARIFTPLGLVSTLLPVDTENTLPEAHANGYLYGTVTEFFETGGVLPPETIAAAESGELLPNDVTDMNPSWGWAAGAAISTTDELARFVQAMVEGELLGPEMQQVRLDSVAPAADEHALYGLGIAKYGELYGHTGELPGYQSFMGHDPERDITIIAWANTMTGPDGQLTANVLSTAAIDQLYPPK